VSPAIRAGKLRRVSFSSVKSTCAGPSREFFFAGRGELIRIWLGFPFDNDPHRRRLDLLGPEMAVRNGVCQTLSGCGSHLNRWARYGDQDIGRLRCFSSGRGMMRLSPLPGKMSESNNWRWRQRRNSWSARMHQPQQSRIRQGMKNADQRRVIATTSNDD